MSRRLGLRLRPGHRPATRLLAATAYGEGSTSDVSEEMAAVAKVLVRQQKARGDAEIGVFILANKSFGFAAHDGNAHFKKLMKAKGDELAKDLRALPTR